MGRRTIGAAVAAGLLLFTAAGCGGSDDEGADETTTTVADDSTTAADDTTTAPDGSETTAPPAGTTDDLASLLLTAADIGDGFTESAYETSTEPGPCGADIDTEHPYDEIVGTVLVDEALQLGFQHELRRYADEATAVAVYQTALPALSCGSETAQAGIVLDSPLDLSSELDAPSFAVGVTTDDGTVGGIGVVQVGPVISVYQYQAPADVPEDQLPDTLAFLTANVAGLKAAFD